MCRTTIRENFKAKNHCLCVHIHYGDNPQQNLGVIAQSLLHQLLRSQNRAFEGENIISLELQGKGLIPTTSDYLQELSAEIMSIQAPIYIIINGLDWYQDDIQSPTKADIVEALRDLPSNAYLLFTCSQVERRYKTEADIELHITPKTIELKNLITTLMTRYSDSGHPEFKRVVAGGGRLTLDEVVKELVTKSNMS
jgi:hypothetical protein